MDIVEQLKRDEGFRATVYLDTVGKRTIGYGHNCDASPISAKSLTEAEATQLLLQDIATVKTKLGASLAWFGSLDECRQGVLINMAFNMGVGGLLGFHNTLAAFQRGDWHGVALGMTNSKWYFQVGARAQRLTTQVLTGIWQ